MIRALAARLPKTWQGELKRWKFWREIRRGSFGVEAVAPLEPEYGRIAEWLRPGGCAIDVGANVAHYTRAFAEAVGPSGRVLAFEPIPQTFELLAGNCRELRNVTLINAAASDAFGFLRMDVPKWEGQAQDNFYRASITASGAYQVMAMTLDSLALPSVDLIKIDAEGHELSVLKGAEALIRRCRPVLIVEMPNAETSAFLRGLGYALTQTDGSPNVVAEPR
jgi:FkbM family methyltransferase